MAEELWSEIIPVVLDNMGWLIALVPLVACFISNWITMGASTYYRIHPSICIAPLSTIITQALGVLFVVAFFFVPIALCVHSLVELNIVLSLLSGFGIVYVLRLTTGEYSMHYEGLLGWVFVVASFLSAAFAVVCDIPVHPGRPFPFSLIDSPTLDPYLSLLVDRVNVADVIALSVLDIVATITLLCVIAYVIGVRYAAHREPRLVSRDKRIMVLSVFSGGICVVARISAIRREDGKRYPVVIVQKPRLYSSITQLDATLEWVRFSRVEFDRSNAEFDV